MGHPIITYKQAVSRGLKEYFNGRPCRECKKYSPKFTHNSQCIACSQEPQKKQPGPKKPPPFIENAEEYLRELIGERDELYEKVAPIQARIKQLCRERGDLNARLHSEKKVSKNPETTLRRKNKMKEIYLGVEKITHEVEALKPKREHYMIQIRYLRTRVQQWQKIKNKREEKAKTAPNKEQTILDIEKDLLELTPLLEQKEIAWGKVCEKNRYLVERINLCKRQVAAGKKRKRVLARLVKEKAELDPIRSKMKSEMYKFRYRLKKLTENQVKWLR